jgi:ATP-binding cassette subfamily B protein
VSHRISTIKDADLILVIDKGIIIERGTHQELSEKGGLYSEILAKQDV